MEYFNYNGKFFEKDTPVIGPDNRSFRYGDGLFETFKFKNDKIILAGEHFDRLWKGMKKMEFQIPVHFTRELLKDQITALIKRNKIDHARVRLSVFRGDGGIYDPVNHLPNYIIQCWPLANPVNSLNENGLHVCIYREAKKSMDSFANLKHNSYLPYYMAANFAKKSKCNDAIILNSADRICDSTIANIFLIKNGIIKTPALSEACIAGVMRHCIIDTLAKNKISVVEGNITEEELLNADEVFLSNSILNLKWIVRLCDTPFSMSKIAEIYQLLSKTNPEVFC